MAAMDYTKICQLLTVYLLDISAVFLLSLSVGCRREVCSFHGDNAAWINSP